MDEMERARKIEAAKDKFVNGYKLPELSHMYEHAFGAAPKTKDKCKIAQRIAEWTVDGDGTKESNPKKEKAPRAKAATKAKSEIKAPAPVPPSTSKPNNVSSRLSDEELAKLAKGILGRAKQAWFELVDLKKEKRAKLAKYGKIIKESRDEIQRCLGDETITETKKLALVEGYWRNLRLTEEKKETVRTDYAERISAQKQIVEAEFDNTSQLNLFD